MHAAIKHENFTHRDEFRTLQTRIYYVSECTKMRLKHRFWILSSYSLVILDEYYRLSDIQTDVNIFGCMDGLRDIRANKLYCYWNFLYDFLGQG